MMSDMEQKVTAMSAALPTVPRHELRRALEMRGSNVDAAIDLLLSEQQAAGGGNQAPIPAGDMPQMNIVYDTGNPAVDAARAAQLREDEQLAQLLQREELQAEQRIQSPYTNLGWQLPSASDVQAGLSVAYESIKQYSDSAYRQLSLMYRKYLDTPAEERPRIRDPDYANSGYSSSGYGNYGDETSVVRGGSAYDGSMASHRSTAAAYSSDVSGSRSSFAARRSPALVEESAKKK